MSQREKKPLFEKGETGYHRFACMELAKWIGGVVNDEPFKVDGVFMFTPDVVTYDNNIITGLYEVVKTHPVNGKKLGRIQYWCYRNFTELSVYEISADYILAQIEKPEFIQFMNVFIIDPFEL